MRRRDLAVLLALGALVILGLERSRMAVAVAIPPGAALAPATAAGGPARSTTTAASSGSVPDARVLPPVAHRQTPLVRAVVPPGCFSPDQARAYAAAGLAADGNPQGLLQLDDAARSVLPRMRELVAAQVPLIGSSRIQSASGLGQPSASSPLPQDGSTIRITAALDLSQADRGLTSDADGIQLTSDQVWAVARLDPSRGHLTLVNQSTGGYVVSLVGSDFGTIRVDGGLVVPGRSYLVHGTMVITGSATCAVQIRPVATAATIYAPAGPDANG